MLRKLAFYSIIKMLVPKSFLGRDSKAVLGNVLKREEAISVLKELLDCCSGLDGHYLELVAINSPNGAGYQIVISKTLDEQTRNCIQDIAKKHQLSYQTGNIWNTRRNKTEPDTFIIYRLRTSKTSK